MSRQGNNRHDAASGFIRTHGGQHRLKITPEQVSFAEAKRRIRASWPDIAAMLNVPVHDLRAAADPAYPHYSRSRVGGGGDV